MRASSPRRLLALVRGLPPEAAAWREDQPGWTQQDELAAKAVESLEHWGPLLLMAWGAKKLPPPARVFEHPDRPAAQEAPGRAGSRPLSVAEFEQQIKEGGR